MERVSPDTLFDLADEDGTLPADLVYRLARHVGARVRRNGSYAPCEELARELLRVQSRLQAHIDAYYEACDAFADAGHGEFGQGVECLMFHSAAPVSVCMEDLWDGLRGPAEEFLEAFRNNFYLTCRKGQRSQEVAHRALVSQKRKRSVV